MGCARTKQNTATTGSSLVCQGAHGSSAALAHATNPARWSPPEAADFRAGVFVVVSSAHTRACGLCTRVGKGRSKHTCGSVCRCVVLFRAQPLTLSTNDEGPSPRASATRWRRPGHGRSPPALKGQTGCVWHSWLSLRWPILWRAMTAQPRDLCGTKHLYEGRLEPAGKRCGIKTAAASNKRRGGSS